MDLMNLDAAESAFIEKELRYQKTRIHERRYPEFKGRDLVPVSHEVPAGAASFSYKLYDEVGVYDFYSAYATDAPVTNIKVQEFDAKVRELAGKVMWTLTEIENAMFAGTSLESRELMAHRRVAEQKVDDLIATGDTVRGLSGFINHPNVSASSVAQGAYSGSAAEKRLWANKTPAEILVDLNEPGSTMVKDTLGREIPDTMCLPIDKYEKISTTPRSDDSDLTILEYFLKTNGHVKQVIPWHKLTNAGTGGAIDRMVVYRRSDEVLTFEEPLPFELRPPAFEALHVEQWSRVKVGGVILYLPGAVAYREGF